MSTTQLRDGNPDFCGWVDDVMVDYRRLGMFCVLGAEKHRPG
jgi:hypothetical protein